MAVLADVFPRAVSHRTPAPTLPAMTLAADRPFRLFAFALREGDWPLAGLLAGALGRDPRGRARLVRGLRGTTPGGGSHTSGGGVRTIGRLVGALGLDDRERV